MSKWVAALRNPTYIPVVNWCAATANYSRLLERCYNDIASFIDLVQRTPCSREASYLTFSTSTSQRFNLRTGLVLTMNNRPTVLSGWEVVYTRNHSIIERTLDEYVIGVRRASWRNILRKQGSEELTRWVYSAATGPQETKEYLSKGYRLSQRYSKSVSPHWRPSQSNRRGKHLPWTLICLFMYFLILYTQITE